MSDCIFCSMARGEIQPKTVYEDDDVLAFHDISPQAPTHILVIPKQHISSTNEADASHEQVLGRLTLTAAKIAKDLGFAESGYRMVMNCGAHGGQTVFHIHMHVLAGRSLSWPPG